MLFEPLIRVSKSEDEKRQDAAAVTPGVEDWGTLNNNSAHSITCSRVKPIYWATLLSSQCDFGESGQ